MRRRAAHATRRIVPRPLLEGLTRLWRGVVRQAQGAWRAGRSSAFTFSLMALAGTLILMLMVNFGAQVIQSARLEAQRSALEGEVSQARQDNARLKAAVEYAESDVNVERVAREQLNYARDGDVVLLPQFALPTAPPAEAAPSALPEPTPVANWRRWQAAFFPPEPTPLMPQP